MNPTTPHATIHRVESAGLARGGKNAKSAKSAKSGKTGTKKRLTKNTWETSACRKLKKFLLKRPKHPKLAKTGANTPNNS